MAEENKITILKLTVADLDAVDELMKPNTRTIGFLPRAVLRDHLDKGWVFGASTRDGRLIGYLLYASYLDRFRVVQLCVSRDFRNKGVARQLIETLKMSATSQKVMRLRCRNDFPANSLWPKFGFVPIDERPGRSKEGSLLTLWRLTLALDDQFELFRANVSDTILDVIIDAQIFFDFDRQDSAVTRPSKALVSDLFVDSVNLWYTDELLNDINHHNSLDVRRASRERTGQFIEATYDPISVEIFAESLKQILPSGNRNQLSDINHLAKAAASEVSVFVTRDQRLLKKAGEIEGLINLQVKSPTELILRLNELSDAQAYEPDRVSGLDFQWRRLKSDELSAFPFSRFLDGKEALGRLRTMVESLLVDPNIHELGVLWSGEEPIALRGLTYGSEDTLTISLGRVATSHKGSLVERFLISDTVYRAMLQDLVKVKFDASSLPLSLIQGLSEMGFTRCGDQFIRFCFAGYHDRKATLVEIAGLAPETVGDYRDMCPVQLERACSPLSSNSEQNHFLIPIKPGYSLNLIDRKRSSTDMFGGNPNVLLLWNKVYYRSADRQKMLRPPGRILWYVSRNPKAIVAVSHLDEVVIDTPKELFRKFRKYGTFEWRDVYEMCGGDVTKSLMVLRFSHTFSFPRDVPIDEIREVFAENEVGLSLRGPSRMSFDTFNKILQLGYPEQS